MEIYTKNNLSWLTDVGYVYINVNSKLDIDPFNSMGNALFIICAFMIMSHSPYLQIIIFKLIHSFFRLVPH